jgi:hypothetical protein
MNLNQNQDTACGRWVIRRPGKLEPGKTANPWNIVEHFSSDRAEVSLIFQMVELKEWQKIVEHRAVRRPKHKQREHVPLDHLPVE